MNTNNTTQREGATDQTDIDTSMSFALEVSLSPDVQRVIDEWQPQKVNPAQQVLLSDVLPAVRHCAAAANPTTPKMARRLLWATTQMMLWAYEEFGYIDIEEVMSVHNVEHFTVYANAHRSTGWKQGVRPALRWVGRAVNPDGWPPKSPTIGQHKVALPYTSDDEEMFSFMASSSTASNREGRLAVVAFPFGAGLRGVEVATVTPSDLEYRHDGRIVVNVRGQWPRRVPVRAAYSDLVREAVEAANGAMFVRGDSHSAAAVIAERLLEDPRTTGRRSGLVLRRARNTWLAAHLRVNTPLAALLTIAGPLSAKTLLALIKHIQAEIDPDEAVEQGMRA